jgi:multidrug efflux pump subunit AcrB
MISLFALIMTLGIIVDDTIVVGEDAYTHMQQGEPPLNAILGGVKRMSIPVIASSSTTIAAFIPLMLISGIIGKLLFAIPFVVVCVILASIFECFLLLPNHLFHSFKNNPISKQHHSLFAEKLTYFRDIPFKKAVTTAINKPARSLIIAVLTLILAISLIYTNRVNFTFFPSPDTGVLNANIEFVAGTPKEVVARFANDLEQQVYETAKQLSTRDEDKIRTTIRILQASAPSRYNRAAKGQNVAHLFIELALADNRDYTDDEFIEALKKI